MKTKLLLTAALVAAGTAATAGPAAAWELLGQRNVLDRMDHDEIWLDGHRRFEQIKICVFRNPVHIYDVDVNFNNGGHQDVAVRTRITPGECDIDLNGDDRDIRNIKLVYEETSWGRHTATVRVFGR